MTFQSDLGYTFKNPELLRQALTHTSFFNENPKLSKGDNERLEFLGDAVLDLVMTEKLYLEFPNYSEGELSKIRASLVNENTLCELAIRMGLNLEMLLGRGELSSGGATKPRLVSSALEALIGALFLDGGFIVARDFVLKHFSDFVEQIDHVVHYKEDFKTRLQEKVQENKKRVPDYILLKEDGPDHSKTFFVEIQIEGEKVSNGSGKTKKQAEQVAAKNALEVLI